MLFPEGWFKIYILSHFSTEMWLDVPIFSSPLGAVTAGNMSQIKLSSSGVNSGDSSAPRSTGGGLGGGTFVYYFPCLASKRLYWNNKKLHGDATCCTHLLMLFVFKTAWD